VGEALKPDFKRLSEMAETHVETVKCLGMVSLTLRRLQDRAS